MSEFEKKLKQAQAESEPMNHISERKSMPQLRQYLQPPIRRVNHDARPLSHAELLAHRHLLQIHSLLQPNPL